MRQCGFAGTGLFIAEGTTGLVHLVGPLEGAPESLNLSETTGGGNEREKLHVEKFLFKKHRKGPYLLEDFCEVGQRFFACL